MSVTGKVVLKLRRKNWKPCQRKNPESTNTSQSRYVGGWRAFGESLDSGAGGADYPPVKLGEAVNGNTILKIIDSIFYFAFYLER